MSLILEALKKSEQQRRIGEAPNLGTPIVVARRRRSALPVLAVAIAIALGAGWYLLRDKPDSAPADTKVASAPTAAPPARDHAPAAAPATAKPAQRPATPAALPPRVTPVRSPHAADPKTATVAPPVLPVPRAQDRPGSVTPPPVPTAASSAMSSGVGKPHDRPAPPGPASPAEQAPKTASNTAPAKPAAAPAATTPTPAAAAPAAQKPVAQKPAQPALPSVWELPYATRKDLPEIDLTMHVYADTPDDRFVVVKGERHVEGDDIADGVKLKHITADGMVLEFKGQDFTFPRDSR